MRLPDNTVDELLLRERTGVFADRAEAGRHVARLMASSQLDRDSLVLAIPAGGVPVAAEAARRLDLPLDLAVVSKITLPWNTEAGYGAVAFDGAVTLNHDLVRQIGLSTEEVERGVELTRAKVERRRRELRGDAPPPRLSDRSRVVLIDDGLASGFTMLAAVGAVRAAGAGEVSVAVPTGHLETVRRMADVVDRLVCPNVRGGSRFAVASAYRRWADVSEPEAAAALARVVEERRIPPRRG